ncbi:MAG: hypothetical protein G01um101477_551 [Candidatus Doudnabacteria bacterium Gr01-1014_77]|uniref:Uncharacterized protein n=1 Tax=Candidatus Doudnabacteria bacterium Gr01-1014_77 TaxID=2017133 RepID=A0A554JA96_9BACT|nr:MAG: hypothetical protein G01um101477_551 [Candidatus Doudnabacteria bacterium Gr01-1014_77]
MRKEVGVYLSVGALVVLGIFIAYLLNVSLTGFAVLQQQSQSDFDQGTYSNALYNGSAVVLSPNQTSGTYTSKVFDATSSVTWNNLTWQSSQPASTSISFEVRVCSSANCSDGTFAIANTNNLNLTGQYFQYRASFSGYSTFDNNTNITAYTSPSLSSASLDYSVVQVPIVTSATVSEPSGTKTSDVGVPITFSASGSADIQCSYSVQDASGADMLTNTTIACNVNSTTFDLGAGEGSYTFNLYVVGSSGFVHKTSSFSVDIGITTPEKPEEPVIEENASIVQIPVTTTQTPTPTAQLTAPEIQVTSINPGKSQLVKWTVQNTGTLPVSACMLKTQGDFAPWVSTSEDSVNLNAGDSHEFALTILVPENTVENPYSLGASVECAETAVAKSFSLSVIKKKLDLNVTSVERTRASRVRAVYSLYELNGVDQDVVLSFSLLDSNNNEVSNASENRSIDANDSQEFGVNLPINVSLNQTLVGNFTLKVDFNSNISTNTLRQSVVLGEPVGGFLGGFAIFEGLGTGGSILVIVVVLALGAIFFVARRMRKINKQ